MLSLREMRYVHRIVYEMLKKKMREFAVNSYFKVIINVMSVVSFRGFQQQIGLTRVGPSRDKEDASSEYGRHIS